MRIINNRNTLRIKFIMLKAALLCVLLGFAGTAAAESVFVSFKHNKIFIADGGLFVKDLDTNTVNTMCSPDGLWFDPAGNDVTPLLGTATDVVVKRNYAVVNASIRC